MMNRLYQLIFPNAAPAPQPPPQPLPGQQLRRRGPQNNIYKLVIWGKYGVGKSSIVTLLEKGDFTLYNPYVIRPDFPYADMSLEDGSLIRLQLWDTAGQERYFQKLRPIHFREADLFLVVYDPTDSDSFKWAQDTLETLSTSPDVDKATCQILLICHHKAKLPNEASQPKETMWAVSKSQGQQLAVEYDTFFMEMNAAHEGALLLLHHKLREMLHKAKLSQQLNN